MSDDNVTINGVTVSTDSLDTALEDIRDGDVAPATTVVGDTVIVGTYEGIDHNVSLANIEHVTDIDEESGRISAESDSDWTFTTIERIESALDDATRSSFVDYLKDISGLGSTNTFGEEVGSEQVYGDAYVSYGGHFSASEMQSLVDDDGVRIGKVRADEGRVSIGLYDERDN